MDNDPLQLRVIVETCRQLLLRINHPETVAHLTALAETYERKLQSSKAAARVNRARVASHDPLA